MNIKIVCFGKITPRHLEAGIEDYLGRMARWARIEVVELPESKGPGALERERDQVLARIRDCQPVLALDSRGKGWSSEEWGRQVTLWRDQNRKPAILLGSADGLHPDLVARSTPVSLGPITLPHSLARLVLAEQLYRAHTIALGLPYHLGH